jgi:hypothetical protein
MNGTIATRSQWNRLTHASRIFRHLRDSVTTARKASYGTTVHAMRPRNQLSALAHSAGTGPPAVNTDDGKSVFIQWKFKSLWKLANP